MKVTTFSLIDIIAVFSWPKHWTNENVSTNFPSSLYALAAPTFQANQFTYWLCRHLKYLHVLVAEISNNAMAGKG
jgi:hypothetical protein